MKAIGILLASVAALCVTGALSANAAELAYKWRTVANNGDLVPDTDKFFNSYNQPAVNERGMVVFRARSRGGDGKEPPAHGIFVRDLDKFGPIRAVFTRGGTVPQPSNALYNDGLASFNEFPSVPRIDSGSDTIVTRGMSQPVWQYTVDGVDTRTGSAGVYTNPKGARTTAASMLGDVPGYEYFQVPIPGVPAGTGFDQFPGAPSVTERSTIVFKGNFNVGGGKTGVFYRDVKANGGVAPIELIASSYTQIPGKKNMTFGSTAPPSAAGKHVVFAGYDNEANPTAGGIYLAQLGKKPIKLTSVVNIGDKVPGEEKQRFKAFGEAVSLSSNGRHVAFWGTWGNEIRKVEVICANEGNEAVRTYCLSVTPKPTYKDVPVNQGIFVRDLQLGTTVLIARTGRDFKDFVYWKFSGRAPGMGEGEGGDDIEEPARWRTSTFVAVSGRDKSSVAAFRVQSADGRDGIYLRQAQSVKVGKLMPLLKTGMSAAIVDPEAPAGAEVTALGLERDGFRGQWLAVNVSMLTAGGSEEDAGWAGVYAVRFSGEESKWADCD